MLCRSYHFVQIIICTSPWYIFFPVFWLCTNRNFEDHTINLFFTMHPDGDRPCIWYMDASWFYNCVHLCNWINTKECQYIQSYVRVIIYDVFIPNLTHKTSAKQMLLCDIVKSYTYHASMSLALRGRK